MINETFEQGVRREVHEETGVWVTVDRLTGLYQNMTLGVVALVFRCAPDTGSPTTTDESAEVRWLAPAAACALMTPAYAARVTDAFDTTTRTRAHDGLNLVTSVRGGSAST